ncbi:hypothetical protein ULMS_21990 [Patiriisocius marinistellae]|uniref:Uncharacterized protein n=1 Tax=Patiriisocius marinistellae TaxID=2494560 RepID=A0A5J4G328_9FLAO|nr:hypothetical protein ULMS_21990 [Patiriisocius marinistellae]
MFSFNFQLFILVTVVAIFIGYIIHIVYKIKMARLIGVKLENRNLFYRVIVTLFLSDLPE